MAGSARLAGVNGTWRVMLRAGKDVSRRVGGHGDGAETCDDAHANQAVVAHELQVVRDVRIMRLKYAVRFLSAHFPAMEQPSQTRHIMRAIQIAEEMCDV